MLQILNDLPVTTGTFVNPLSNGVSGRHLILLPLTKGAIIQYCTKVLVNLMKVTIYHKQTFFQKYKSTFLYIFSKN